MSTRQWWQTVSAVLIGALGAMAVWFALARIWPILVLFGLGAAIAHLLDPYLDRLQKRGWSRLQAVWVVSLVGVIAVGLLMTWLVPSLLLQVQAIARAWPAYTARANELYEQANKWVLARVDNEEVAARYDEFLDDQWAQLQAWLAQKFPAVIGWVSQQLVRWVGGLFVIVMLVVVAFHFMLIIDEFRVGLKQVIPAAAIPHVATILSQIAYLLGQYVKGLVTTAICVGALSTLGLGVVSLYFDTRYWLLIGILAGLLYFVPWVGGAIAQVVAAFFGYTTAAEHAGWSALASWAVVVVVNQGCDILLMPRIVGRRVGLHPLAVLFGIFCGYALFGVAGVIVATPLMVSAKIVLAHWLPVKGPPPTERAPREPLAIDLGAALAKGQEAVRSLGQRLEAVMTRAGRGDAQKSGESTDDGSQRVSDEKTDEAALQRDESDRDG